MASIQLFSIILLMLLMFSFKCSSQKEENVLNQDDVILVDSLGSNRICFHRNMDEVAQSLHPLIIKMIKLGIDSISKHIEVKDVEFRVLVFPEKTIPRLGISGSAPNKEHIYILLNPSHAKFYEAITVHLIPTLAHEYHHTLRYRTVGYGNNLFEAMISEGLADHFCLEVTKIDTPSWSKALSDSGLILWREKAEKEWFRTEYDHLAWFIGLNSDIPRGTGYAIGFKMVSDYLRRHPGETASSLFDTSADSFLVINYN